MASFSPHRCKNSLKNDIYKLEREIDEVIYKLYGLTNEEIKSIEQ